MSSKFESKILDIEALILKGTLKLYERIREMQLKIDRNGSSRFTDATIELLRSKMRIIEAKRPLYGIKKKIIVFYDYENGGYYYDEAGTKKIPGAPESLGILNKDHKSITGPYDIDYEIRPVVRPFYARREEHPPKRHGRKLQVIYYDEETEKYYYDEEGTREIPGAPKSLGTLNEDGDYISGFGDTDYLIRPVKKLKLQIATDEESFLDDSIDQIDFSSKEDAEKRFIPRFSTVLYDATSRSIIPFKSSMAFDDIFSLEVIRTRCANESMVSTMKDDILIRLDADYRVVTIGPGIITLTSDKEPTITDKSRYHYIGNSTLHQIAMRLDPNELSRLSDDTLFQILRYIGPAKTEELLSRVPDYLYDCINKLRNIWLIGYAKGISDAFRENKLELIQNLLTENDIRTVLDCIDDIIEFYPMFVGADKDMSFLDDLKSIDNILSLPSNNSESFVL